MSRRRTPVDPLEEIRNLPVEEVERPREATFWGSLLAGIFSLGGLINWTVIVAIIVRLFHLAVKQLRVNAPKALVSFVLYLIALVRIFFCPLPWGPFSGPLVGAYNSKRHLFFALPHRFMCVSWLVVAGWIYHGVGELHNLSVTWFGAGLVTEGMLAWYWILTLIFTVLVIADDYSWDSFKVLLPWIVVVALAATVWELATPGSTVQEVVQAITAIEVTLDLGAPAIVSSVLGGIFVLRVIYANLFDRISHESRGNYIFRENVLRRTGAREKEDASPQLEWDCLIKRFFFGIGRIHFPSVPDQNLPEMHIHTVRAGRVFKRLQNWLAVKDVSVEPASGTVPPPRPQPTAAAAAEAHPHSAPENQAHA